MTRLANPALRLKRRRRRFIAGLAFAAMALPAAGVAAPYKDPVVPSASTSTYQLPSNFRSEATDGHAQAPAPAPATVTVQANGSNGFDWGDAGIGAATIVGLLALGGGMTLLVSHNRRRSPGTTAVA
jgi:hypothetical protein